MADYKILSRYNLELIHQETQIPIKELEKQIDEAEKFGHVVAFWVILGAWFSIKISEHYIYDDYLERAMEKAIQASMDEGERILGGKEEVLRPDSSFYS